MFNSQLNILWSVDCGRVSVIRQSEVTLGLLTAFEPNVELSMMPQPRNDFVPDYAWVCGMDQHQVTRLHGELTIVKIICADRLITDKCQIGECKMLRKRELIARFVETISENWQIHTDEQGFVASLCYRCQRARYLRITRRKTYFLLAGWFSE